MLATAMVETQIDERVKREAEEIYASAGLTISEVFRLMLIRTVAEHALPFDPLIPNAETIEAMEAARRGEMTHFQTVEALMADLNADD